MTPEEVLLDESINLPAPPEPAGVYEPIVRCGNLLYLSGHIPPASDVRYVGRVGEDVDVETAQQAAEYVARQMLATVRKEIGSLNHVVRPVKVTGFVRCTPEFTDIPAVVNGFSKVLTKVFGSQGRCARSSLGIASLPGGVCVEVEAIFEVDAKTPR
ncbi:RidA family protein [Alienimonas californiensis]|uniref:Endoribonuclease L-PSP n=1 Tax=Alienimonas californiensis TaxID=2527989 RepID=A0A517PAB1_9PLAN|nr:RidA family protein [Alienimonas californiensis]QDT16313.1 Endoribonuclease L-PSP [Alienimonas californiensis]